MLLRSIANLMDYPEDRQDELVNEFNHKYIKSHILLEFENGKEEVVYNEGLVNGYLYTSLGKLGLDTIKSIKPIHPKTGLYANGKTLFYLTRKAKRQYIKSFKLETTYSVYYCITEYCLNETQILNSTYLGNHAIFQDKVYLFWKQVGRFENNTIFLSNKFKHLMKEVQELWKQYKIILDSPPLRTPITKEQSTSGMERPAGLRNIEAARKVVMRKPIVLTEF